MIASTEPKAFKGNITVTTMRDLVESTRSGVRPVVTFHTKAIEGTEGYPEMGMRARITGAELRHDGDVIVVDFDFSEFEEHNKAFESRNYFDKHGNATLTAREHGSYVPQDGLYLGPDDQQSAFFRVDSDARLEVYAAFKASGSTSTYVQWLEDKVLAASPRDVAAPVAETRDEAVARAWNEVRADLREENAAADRQRAG